MSRGSFSVWVVSSCLASLCAFLLWVLGFVKTRVQDQVSSSGPLLVAVALPRIALPRVVLSGSWSVLVVGSVGRCRLPQTVKQSSTATGWNRNSVVCIIPQVDNEVLFAWQLCSCNVYRDPGSFGVAPNCRDLEGRGPATIQWRGICATLDQLFHNLWITR